MLTSLTREELRELAALFFLGRGEGRTLEAGLREADNIPEQHLAGHIAEKATIDRMVRRGLGKIGIEL